MNQSTESFQKYERNRSAKRKPHDSDKLIGRDKQKKKSYSGLRGLKRNSEWEMN